MEARDAFEKLTDTDLMLRVQWGSEYAFAELYRRYLGKLHRFFYGMGRGVLPTRDASLADDLCHETFLRLWQMRARYTPTGSFPSYFFRVARNIWHERQRTAYRDWRIHCALDSKSSEEPAGSSFTPEDSAHHVEIQERVGEVLATLPEEQRMAFVLRSIDGLSLEEIAAIMECPVNTVRSRRQLALARLRAVLRGLFVLL